jgi:hypothetical protein
MNRLNGLLFMLVIVGSVFFTSCKKEERIEKNLWSKGGEWKVKTLEVDQTSSVVEDNYSESIGDIGTFSFKKDGTGSYIFTLDGDSEAGTFTYSNTEDKLTFIYDNEPRVFRIVDWERNSLKISITEDYDYNGVSTTYNETMTLEKN